MTVKEDTLRLYFSGQVVAAELAKDLRGGISEAQDTTRFHIEDMATPHVIEPGQLVMVCDDYLSGVLSAKDLRLIGFCILSSDWFTWEDSDEGGRIVTVANEWATPEVSHAVDHDSVAAWRDYLCTGDYRL